MSRFDEDDASASALAAAFRLVRSRPGTTIAAVALTVALTAVALAAAVATIAAPAALALAVPASPLTVFVSPQAARADAEALGSRLKSLPAVADATFRPKEEALAGLAAAGLPTTDHRNPLPDAWIVRLSTGSSFDGSFVTLATATRDGIAGLANVDAVRVDGAWFQRLDAVAAQWRRYGRPTLGATLLVAAVLQVAAWFLWSRAVGGAARLPRAVAAAVVSGLVAAGVVAALELPVATLLGADPAMKPIAAVAGHSGVPVGVGIVVAAAFCAAAGALVKTIDAIAVDD